jgi:hypothetical protein
MAAMIFPGIMALAVAAILLAWSHLGQRQLAKRAVAAPASQASAAAASASQAAIAAVNEIVHNQSWTDRASVTGAGFPSTYMSWTLPGGAVSVTGTGEAPQPNPRGRAARAKRVKTPTEG